jgi:hypothetical protein
MIRKNSFYFFIFVLLAYLFSCETAPPCDDANGVQANLGFFYYDGTELTDTLIDSLVVYTFDKEPVPFFDGTKTKNSTVALQLSMLNDTSIFIFEFGTDGTDTVKFIYTQYTNLVSHECGFVNFYELQEVKSTTNLIDSVWIRKELVEYGDDENVKIYF